MNPSAKAIMDAAERHMRVAGLDGFSFRDIASEIGMKSSSVHYHFPTKESLVSAVVRRYVSLMSERIDRRMAAEADPVQVWTRIIGDSLLSEDGMCPCTVLGASARALSPGIAMEVARFFRMCLDKLTAEGLPRDRASAVLSTLVGALVVSNALGDADEYHRATGSLRLRQSEIVA
jgi:TetR/AcrR family transcriptional regulator, transcriptional repressor for nem operon